jgi:hypothetical protein
MRLGFWLGDRLPFVVHLQPSHWPAFCPKHDKSETNLTFTVVSVTVASTVAMIVYPIAASVVGFDDRLAGIFLGGTIHDVAQVVGAGFSMSDETGEVATLIKLFRVTMLAPVVFVGALVLRKNAPAETAPPIVPMFVLVFIVLAGAEFLSRFPYSFDRIFQSPVTCLFDYGCSCGWDEDIASGFAEGWRWGRWFGRLPDSVLGDFCDAGSVGVRLTFGGKDDRSYT